MSARRRERPKSQSCKTRRGRTPQQAPVAVPHNAASRHDGADPGHHHDNGHHWVSSRYGAHVYLVLQSKGRLQVQGTVLHAVL